MSKEEELTQRLHDLLLEMREQLKIDVAVVTTMRLRATGEDRVELQSNSITIGDIPKAMVGMALMQIANDHLNAEEEAKEEEKVETRPDGATLQ